MAKTKKSVYLEWLKKLTKEVNITLWDTMDSTRIMTIHGVNEDNDYYYDVSYYDDTTGERWSKQREYMWDIVDVLQQNNVRV